MERANAVGRAWKDWLLWAGMAIGSYGRCNKNVGHGGSQQGASAMMLIAPEARAGVVVLIRFGCCWRVRVG